jgi:hypothetical protein
VAIIALEYLLAGTTDLMLSSTPVCHGCSVSRLPSFANQLFEMGPQSPVDRSGDSTSSREYLRAVRGTLCSTRFAAPRFGWASVTGRTCLSKPYRVKEA